MKESKRKSKLLIYLLPLFVIIFLLFLWVKVRPPLWYYQKVAMSIQELPARLIRPGFRNITGWDLPGETEKIRAIHSGGKNPSIFVSFQTDSEGISYIREQITEQIAPTGSQFEPFTGTLDFPLVSQWQNNNGLDVLNRQKIESGLQLLHIAASGVSYEIVIDTQQNSVYMLARQN